MLGQLRGLLGRVRHDHFVFLTGAGISADRGIPTFRGADGYWTVGSANYLPTELCTRHAFSEMSDVVWSWSLHMRGVCNAAHKALVRMQQALGQRFLLITQNVDGLHRRAGISPGSLLEIHGNANLMRCWDDCCPLTFPIPESIGPKARDQGLSEEERALLVCPHCGGLARPHMLCWTSRTV